MSLEVGFEIPKAIPFLVCLSTLPPTCGLGINSQLLLQHRACLPVPMLSALMIMDSNSLEL